MSNLPDIDLTALMKGNQYGDSSGEDDEMSSARRENVAKLALHSPSRSKGSVYKFKRIKHDDDEEFIVTTKLQTGKTKTMQLVDAVNLQADLINRRKKPGFKARCKKACGRKKKPEDAEDDDEEMLDDL